MRKFLYTVYLLTLMVCYPCIPLFANNTPPNVQTQTRVDLTGNISRVICVKSEYDIINNKMKEFTPSYVMVYNERGYCTEEYTFMFGQPFSLSQYFFHENGLLESRATSFVKDGLIIYFFYKYSNDKREIMITSRKENGEIRTITQQKYDNNFNLTEAITYDINQKVTERN